ncbi:hypothetical protein [Arthrobacter sp. H5]|uniref:hypothetical protein n=1 Tax=Arthrobacter sp. H5 TaxID=1267973 RepID=UPI000484E011|nr:hypothetical protein [Arthrobacter sp. H5]
MNIPSLTLISLLIGALLFYGVLRVIALTPGSDRTGVETARVHAFWTGLIGWLAGSGTALYSVGTVRPEDAGSDPFPAMLLAFAIPGIALSVVHFIGQFTWPRHRRRVRRASLGTRRVTDFVPTRLAALVAILFIIAVGISIVVRSVDPLAPVQVAGPTPEGFTQPGRVDGETYSGALLMALIVFVIGLALALIAVARRRPLETLSEANDRILRRISMNRLLRTAGFYLLALINAALNHARWPESAWGRGFDLVFSASSIGGLVLILVLAAWKPPRMKREEPDTLETEPHMAAPRDSAAGLLPHIFGLIAAAITLIAAVAIVGLIPVEGNATRLQDPLFPPQFAAAGIAYLITVAATRSLPSRRNSGLQTTNRAATQRTCGKMPRPSAISGAVAGAGLGLLILTVAVVLVASPAANRVLLRANAPAAALPAPFPDLAFLLPTAIGLLILIAALGVFRWNTGREPGSVNERQLHHALCVFGAVCLAMAAAVIWSAVQRWSVSGGFTPDDTGDIGELVRTVMNLSMPLWIIAALSVFTPAPISQGRTEREPAPTRTHP